VCLTFFSICPDLLGEPGSSGSLPAQPSEDVNMKENYFLNPRNYFLNRRNYVLNSRNCFLNPGNYCSIKFQKLFLKSWKQFLHLGTKPRNHSPSFYHSQPLDKDSSESSEPCCHQESKAARPLVQAFFILFHSMFFDSPSHNQALLLTSQPVIDFHTIS
jgi:hypothetical protein